MKTPFKFSAIFTAILFALVALVGFDASAQSAYFYPPSFFTNYTVNTVYTNPYKGEIIVSGTYSNCTLSVSSRGSARVPIATAAANSYALLSAPVNAGETFVFSNNATAGGGAVILTGSTNIVTVPLSAR